MPSHLQQFLIDIDTELEKWEMKHETEYTATTARPDTLQKCSAEGQMAALKSQRENVLMKQFPDLSQRTGIFRAVGPPGSYIGGTSDQIVIPIRITKDSVYITPNTNTPQIAKVSLWAMLSSAPLGSRHISATA
ncbi:uncharacterized protein BDZ99DRAFT_103344 [Mytilinidion resinicola]|uniref:Uncharacterized protein n=1 Tax=Mytilinidion resinicola TaxID=574789 RepID=A0A6A6YB79_9PEZI|nr:uncharacterized protein BDZ99DRAFT_103344 [Mytilinidion resinicola]KAF2806062.1 hypothetical protein BDZ99DRAFT_103344 [Mytilinidion resinicola]